MPDTKPTKGRLKVLAPSELAGQELVFHFNPTEYTITKQNDWQEKAAKGQNVPKLEFGGGKPRKLQMELLFDAFSVGTGGSRGDPKSLSKTMNLLFNLMMTGKDPQTKGQNSQMSNPPMCSLIWGQFTEQLMFKCYITDLSAKYTMFDENGLPIRATATLSLIEARDPGELLPTNPTSLGEPGRRLHAVVEGERLDWIAHEEYGTDSEWRRIAEANHLRDVRELRPGMTLVIPPF